MATMRLIGPGHIAFAVGMAGLGVLGLSTGDFAVPWQPIPEWLPWREDLAYVSGLILLAGSIGVLFKRSATRCAFALSLYLLIFWVFPQVARLAPHPMSFGRWLGFCETLAVLCGSSILSVSLLRQDDTRDMKSIDSDARVRVARILFGVSCVIFGLSHFVYADFTATMVPQWLPERLWFAYFTGAIHFAAGVGIACAILPRLAATLEALMMSSFVLLVHAPSIGSTPPLEWAPTSRLEWTALFWALALAASAWIVAGSLRQRPWGFVPTSQETLPL